MRREKQADPSRWRVVELTRGDRQRPLWGSKSARLANASIAPPCRRDQTWTTRHPPIGNRSQPATSCFGAPRKARSGGQQWTG